MKAWIVAVGRVLETRLRTSPTAQRISRRALAALARRSRDVRAFVRLHVMPMVR